MIEMTNYEIVDRMHSHEWKITYSVDGLEGIIFASPKFVETDYDWDATKAQTWLEENEAEFLKSAQDDIQFKGLAKFNRATNEIEFPTATKTQATQTATDFLTESPPIPSDAAEAKAWLEAEVAKDRKSHVLMTFCQYMMAFDHQEFKDGYLQAIADLEQIEGLSNQQIQNKLGDIIRGMATIQRKTLRALKRMVVGT